MNEKLGFKYNPSAVKEFLRNDFSYFSDLYTQILEAYYNDSHRYPYIYLNRLNVMDNQFLLLLSGITLKDQEAEEKSKLIPYELDRFF
ncbi:MAG: hypothetical protein WD077_05950 [Bacteroidia bacterium]